MAVLAYVLLPLTGLLAYFTGSTERIRWHGLQAIALGVAWPVALYACAFISPGATQVAFVVGAVVWIGLLVTTARGRDWSLPLIGGWLRRAARTRPT